MFNILFFGFLADVPDRAVVLIVFLILFPILTFCGALIGGYLLSPLYLLLHKKIIGREMIYGIEERTVPKEFFDKTWRGLFPALMALSFALTFLFNAIVLSFFFNIEKFEEGADLGNEITPVFLILLLIFIVVTSALFGGVWFLLDAGIVYSNKVKVKNTDQPIEDKSVGGFYKILLRGYAGIGAIIAYYQFVVFLLTNIIQQFDIYFILALSFFIPFPIYIAIAMLPAIILLDIIKQQRIKYTRKWASKFGITDYVELTFEKKS